MTTLQHRNLPLLLLHARESVIAHFRPVLNQHGVTEQQWRVLRILLDAGSLEPRQIGDASRISSPSMAGILTRLDDMGLVRRERVAHDQRRVMVSLTAKAEALAEQLAPDIDAMYARIEAGIGAVVMARFYATLDELVDLMGQLDTSGDQL